MRHVLNPNTRVCSCGRTRENHLNIELTSSRVRERWSEGDVNLDRDFAEIGRAFVEYIRLGKWVPCHIEEILLDPLAWKAVGKVEGWDEPYPKGFKVNGNTTFYIHGRTWPGWKIAMHRMIDALAEGKTIEEFISTL